MPSINGIASRTNSTGTHTRITGPPNSVLSIPRTSKGHKRSADVISNAVHVMKLATGEREEELTEYGENKAAVALWQMGGHARAKALPQLDERRPPQNRARTPPQVVETYFIERARRPAMDSTLLDRLGEVDYPPSQPRSHRRETR
jgi:hypothetical protein